MMSSAAVSLASTQPPPSSRPSTSGQKPCGSRTPMRWASSISTNENPPRRSRQHLLQRELELAAVRAGLVGPLAGDRARRRARSRWWSRSSSRPAVIPGQHPEAGRELGGVGEVAVVAEREAGVADRPVDRLRVLPRRRAGGRVAVVADREVALQRGEPALVEHLGDEAHVLRHGDRLAVAHRDAGGLLAAVLEREQAEVGQLRDRLAGAVHAEDAAGVARGLVRETGREDRRGRAGGARRHYPTSTRRRP